MTKKRIGVLDYLRKEKIDVTKEITLLNTKDFGNADIFDDKKGGKETCLYVRISKA